jgi:uncharacterized protein (TIRG00374 family)
LNTSKTRLKRIAIGLNLVLIVLLVAGFAYYGDPEAMLSILGTADWRWFALAVAVGLLSSFVTSTRLWLLIRKQEIKIALGELFAINLGVRFYSFFSPFSSVGTIMRWIRLVPTGQSAGGFAALAANRFFEILVPLSMGAFWALGSVSLDILSPWAILVYLVGLLLAVWAALRFSGDFTRQIAQAREQTSSRVIGTVLRALETLLASLERYRTLSGREVVALIGLALAGDIIGLLGHVLIARSIDLPIAFMDIGWIRAIMLLVAMAPFTLPGGFGLREVSTIVLVTALGVDVGHATAYSILLYSRMLITALVGGAVELLFNLRTFRAGFTS